MSNPLQPLANEFYDASVRIDSILWLCSHGDYTSGEPLVDFILEEPSDAKRLLGVDPPERTIDVEDYLTELYHAGKHGFLIKASTPILQAEGYFSWGYTTYEWFYFDQFEPSLICQTLCTWADEKHHPKQTSLAAA